MSRYEGRSRGPAAKSGTTCLSAAVCGGSRRRRTPARSDPRTSPHSTQTRCARGVSGVSDETHTMLLEPVTRSEVSFDPLVEEWFARKFGEPTAPQIGGWPLIDEGRDVLISAPTG